ncbi:MAG: hypothetical protein AAFU61_10240, partial [Pseudomonadota bacterium]
MIGGSLLFIGSISSWTAAWGAACIAFRQFGAGDDPAPRDSHALSGANLPMPRSLGQSSAQAGTLNRRGSSCGFACGRRRLGLMAR